MLTLMTCSPPPHTRVTCRALKRVQASHICGSAHKFLAALHKRRGGAAEAEAAMQRALDSLQVGLVGRSQAGVGGEGL